MAQGTCRKYPVLVLALLKKIVFKTWLHCCAREGESFQGLGTNTAHGSQVLLCKSVLTMRNPGEPNTEGK